jgi:hypothetical protein
MTKVVRDRVVRAAQYHQLARILEKRETSQEALRVVARAVGGTSTASDDVVFPTVEQCSRSY